MEPAQQAAAIKQAKAKPKRVTMSTLGKIKPMKRAAIRRRALLRHQRYCRPIEQQAKGTLGTARGSAAGATSRPRCRPLPMAPRSVRGIACRNTADPGEISPVRARALPYPNTPRSAAAIIW